MKAKLRYHQKHKFQDRFVMELAIHDVGPSKAYPDGIKYGLICKDLKSGHFVLMDNHHPKGPHIHIGDREISYEFVSDQKLIEDFEALVFQELGVKL